MENRKRKTEGRVRVMNASYEDLSTTSLPRAINLVLNGSAAIEEAHDSVIISVDGSVHPVPKVIRLLKYRKVGFSYSEVPWSKRGVLERDKHKCGYCLKNADTLDHILPKSKGGENSWINSISACRKCNSIKANRTPEEAEMPLLFEPKKVMKMYIKNNKRN